MLASFYWVLLYFVGYFLTIILVYYYNKYVAEYGKDRIQLTTALCIGILSWIVVAFFCIVLSSYIIEESAIARKFRGY
jgi:hypothetical protein